MFKPAVEDLQQQIYELKKRTLELREENHLHKVKIRKLQEEVKSRDKQLELVLDPKRAYNLKKILSQHGVSLVLKLRQENYALQKEVDDKNQLIKKLQWQIDTIKLYYRDKGTICSTMKIFSGMDEEEKSYKSVPLSRKKDRRSKSVNSNKQRSRPNSPKRKIAESTSDLISENYISMLNTNLEIIKSNGVLDLKDASSQLHSCPKSPSVIGGANSANRDTPHEEIQQLQGCLMNVLTEVDSLKDTIILLKEQQKKTHHVLEAKNSNIEKLAGEIENLKLQQIFPVTLNQCGKMDLKNSDVDLSTIEETTGSDVVEGVQDESTEGENRLCAKKSIKDLKTLNRSVCVQTIRSFYTKKFTDADEELNVMNTSISACGGYNKNMFSLCIEDIE